MTKRRPMHVAVVLLSVQVPVWTNVAHEKNSFQRQTYCATEPRASTDSRWKWGLRTRTSSSYCQLYDHNGIEYD